MSTLVATDHPSIVAPVLARVLPVPFPQHSPGDLLHIEFSGFDLRLAVPISDFIASVRSGKVTVKAPIGKAVIIVIELSGRLVESDKKFQIEEVLLDVELKEERARAEFIASSFIAMFCLADEVSLEIDNIELEIRRRFDLPLSAISQRLQMRQMAYRLMTIERALGIEFLLPANYSGSEAETISFIYHAIVDRTFTWPIDTITLDIPANKESLDLLPLDKQPSPQVLGPNMSMKTLFGHSILLGREEIFINDMIIENPNAVKRILEQDDGHIVQVIVRSLSRQAMIKLPDAPHLPDSPWDPAIKALIDVERQLDTRLAERYHLLAGSTLAELSEEEKREITARPELDGDAFLMNDRDGDNI